MKKEQGHIVVEREVEVDLEGVIGRSRGMIKIQYMKLSKSE